MGIIGPNPATISSNRIPTQDLTYTLGNSSFHMLSVFSGQLTREDGNNLLLNTNSGEAEARFSGTERITFFFDGSSSGISFPNVLTDVRVRSESAASPFRVFANAGAEIILYPEAHGSTPNAIDISSPGAGNINLSPNTGSVLVDGWEFDGSQMVGGGAVDSRLTLNTVLSTDNKAWFMFAAGAADPARAAGMSMYGVDHATEAGNLVFDAGNVAGAETRFRTLNTVRWTIESDGDLISTGGKDIGATGNRIGTLFANTVDATTIIGGTVVDPLGTDHIKETRQTTDATLTTAVTIPLGADEMRTIEVLVAADGQTAGKNYFAKLIGAARRDGGGSAVLIGGGTPAHSGSEGAPGYAASLAVSGNDLLIQIQGAAAETVDWTILYIDTVDGGEGLALVTGTEIATKMTIDGSIVYAKLIDFGSLPNNGTKNVAHGITSLDEFVWFDARVFDGSTFWYQQGEFFNASSTNRTRIDSTNIQVITSTNLSAYDAKFILYYTKV